MSNKNIRLNITADTSQAKKEFEKLNKHIGDGKFNVKRTGKVKNKHEETNANSSIDELTNILTGLNGTVRNFEKAVNNLNKESRKSRRREHRENKSSQSSSSSSSRSQREEQKLATEKLNGERKKQQQEQKSVTEFGNKIGNLASTILAGINLKAYASNSISTAQSNNLTSMGTYARLGIYGNDFSKGTKDAYKIGKSLGYNATDTMSLQNQLLSTTGFSSKGRLDQDTESVQRFSKAYGLNTSESIGTYSELVKRGGLTPGQASDVTDVISTSINKQGMQGRESEQVKAIDRILDVITSGKISVSSEDLKASAGILDALGRQNAALKGEKGAEFLGKTQGLFNTSNYTMLRLLGYGEDGNVGPEAMAKIMEQADRGWSDPENFKQIQQNLPKFVGYNETNQKFLLRQHAGMSMTEAGELIKALKNNSPEDIYNKYDNIDLSGQDKILSDIESSRTNARELRDVNREEAQNTAGDAAINALGPMDNLYNSMPMGAKIGGDLAGGVLGGLIQGTIVRRGLKGIGSFASKMNGEAIKGTGLGNIFSNIFKNTAASSADDAVAGGGKLLSSLGGKFGKIAPKLGKVGVALPAVIGGAQAIGSFSKGENEKASEQLGSGLGATGGAILGAKAGAALGTAIPVPVVGTAVGALGGLAIGGLGGWLGGKVGKGIYNKAAGNNTTENLDEIKASSKSSKDNKRENEILAWKERLLRKEEEIFDNILSLSSDKDKTKENKETPKDSLKEGDSLRGQLFDALASGNQAEGYKLITGEDLPESSSDSKGGVINNAKNAVEAQIGDFLGKISAKYEVGGLRGDAISNTKGDYGGKSYGVPQFSTTTGSAKAFVGSLKGTPFEKFFSGSGNPGSSSFDNAWKKAYNSDPNGFTKKQQEYAFNNYAVPLINKIKKEKGVDLNSSRALQELAFSTSIQFGGGSLGVKALGNINAGMNEKEIINTSFANKRNNVGSFFKSSSRAIQNSLKNNRFVTEEQDLLALLNQAPLKSYAIGTDKVDRDQLAYIHKDEAVLNKFDAENYRKESTNNVNGTVNLNFNINANGQSTDNIAVMIENGIKQALQRLGMNNGSQIDLSKSYLRYQN